MPVIISLIWEVMVIQHIFPPPSHPVQLKCWTTYCSLVIKRWIERTAQNQRELRYKNYRTSFEKLSTILSIINYQWLLQLLSIAEFVINASLSEHYQFQRINSFMYHYTSTYRINVLPAGKELTLNSHSLQVSFLQKAMQYLFRIMSKNNILEKDIYCIVIITSEWRWQTFTFCIPCLQNLAKWRAIKNSSRESFPSRSISAKFL